MPKKPKGFCDICPRHTALQIVEMAEMPKKPKGFCDLTGRHFVLNSEFHLAEMPKKPKGLCDSLLKWKRVLKSTFGRNAKEAERLL